MTLVKIKQDMNLSGRKLWMWGLVAFLLALLIAGSSYFTKAYAVIIDGEVVAVVDNQVKAEEVIEEIITLKSKEVGRELKPSQKVEIAKTTLKENNKVKKVSLEELAALLNNQLAFTTSGVALLIDGEEQLVLESKAKAEQLLEEVKATYIKENIDTEIVSVNIQEAIEFKNVEVGLDEYTPYETALALLTQGTEKVEKHIVVEGDSLWTIARANNLQVAELQDANPELKSDLLAIGQEINLIKLEPQVNVAVELKQKISESIPFNTKYVSDSKIYSGQQKVTQAGKRGEREVVYRIVQSNGITIEKEELQSKVITKPTERIIARGTMVAVASRGNGTGQMLWPVNGRITSRFGNRSGGFHYAIDIAVPTGTNVKASSAGTVTSAGWNGSYGNLVEIDHGNGVTTRYAHNSALLVSVGKRVEKGQVIARSGNTGRSTGPHVHFEVRVNGQAKNPLNYLN